MIAPFHLAIPVDDLAAARHFYGEVLGCAEGRSSETWVDFDFQGHQLVIHRAPRAAIVRNPVDGDAVPVPHFGLVLAWDDWQALGDRIAASGTAFELPPHVRFAGKPGEQGTFFLFDPAGNALEFKAMRNPANLFAKQ
ncbi:VOC family protein [Sandarakinorhabdus sp. DWP1-3-1]|uniref:VOC family protein n=1 Tax=Sandarakinorhabdus sp. DWP1-3-1 TaxID=2804627 RepID=UPI003CF3FE25